VRAGDGTGAGRAEREGTGAGVRAPERVGDGTGLGIEVPDGTAEGTGLGAAVRDRTGEGTGLGAAARDGTGEGVAEPGPGLLPDTAESSPAPAGWPPPPDAATARPVPLASRTATGTPSQAIARVLGVLI
jgi:hypothetical protein